jgi:O-antigen/teichoic acid export membrane protein
MTYTALPFITIAIVSREYIIPLFYSAEFLEAAVYLPFHFIGLFFSIWNYCFVQMYTPTGRIKYLTMFGFINNTIFLGLVYFLVPIFGLWGWVARYVVGIFLSLMINIIFWYFSIRFRLSRENYFLLLIIIGFMAVLLFFRNNLAVSLVVGIAGLVTAWLVMKKKERQFLLKKLMVLNKFRNKNNKKT